MKTTILPILATDFADRSLNDYPVEIEGDRKIIWYKGDVRSAVKVRDEDQLKMLISRIVAHRNDAMAFKTPEERPAYFWKSFVEDIHPMTEAFYKQQAKSIAGLEEKIVELQGDISGLKDQVGQVAKSTEEASKSLSERQSQLEPNIKSRKRKAGVNAGAAVTGIKKARKDSS